MDEKKKSMFSVSSILAVLLSLFQLYTCWRGSLDGMLQPVVHLTFVLLVTYTVFKGKTTKEKIYNAVCLAATIVVMGYILLFHKEIINRMPYLDPVTGTQVVLGSLMVLLLLEHSRKTIGIAMPAIAVCFIAYAFLGPWMPGFLYHNGTTLPELIEQLYLTFNGIFGTALIISATVVFIFVLFGSFLEQSGAGDLFMELVKSIAGHFRGGPALMAIITSAFLGTISGSAIANTVTTGSFTIPLMKRVGYDRNFAGAVEAVASTGGQIMPPVMGAGAFIMAEYLGLPYSTIIIAAFVPALLYFLGVGFQVYLEARKLDLPKIPREELPKFKESFKKSWHVLFSLAAIVYFITSGFTPMRAGLYGIITILLVVFIKDRKKVNLTNIYQALEKGGKAAISVASACATAGIIIGIVRLTGIGLKASSLIISLSQGYLIVALVLTALTCIILGMGLPTTAAYIIQAAIAAPALVNMGVDPLAAHLFVFYFACLAGITPPVALCAYAAAPIAEGDATKIGFHAFFLGIAAYIVPFMFVYGPAILLIGEPTTVILGIFTALIGIACLAITCEGWLGGNLHAIERLLFLTTSLLLIKPGLLTDVIGAAILIVLFAKRYTAIKRLATAS
ncbi:MAG: TRAP transporter permease [Desulfitobacteriaceae bacterium]|nr:TRAP transporter permease [Desulfitobacteriaceae bacterium]